MNKTEDDEAVEKWLSAVLAAEPPADGEEFTATVLRRLGREASRRRAWLTVGYVAAGIAGLVSVPDASVVWASLTPATLAGMMTLSALCSVVWTATLD
jgi:hypothetical protein